MSKAYVEMRSHFYVRVKIHHFQSENGGRDRGREAKLRISSFPRF